MALDPVIAAFLEASKDQPRVETLPVEQARAGMAAMTEQLKALGPQVADTSEREIDGPAGPLRVRIYRPAGDEPLPVIVFFHGGGWVLCSLDTHDNVCRGLSAGTNAIVVSVDYRLAPENRYPAAIDDCFAATQWAAANAASIGGDPAKIAAAGDSAGGNLAAAVALRARDSGGPALVGQLLVYPVTDYPSDAMPSYAENGEGYGLTRPSMEFYWEQYLGESPADAPYAAPLRASDLSGLPPAFVITAEYDVLRDEGEAYAGALKAAGTDVEVTRYAGVNHGFFSMAGLVTAATQATEDACAWLKARFA
ncbi:alpha/beta hydrolase fold domain-containing protein [Sphingoaurantiacus capsulatus]|uniref:Alpha/beta hydrolase fold domain-containing protein n=1 Tax=Sphingoaurantiacus capsulatus TaxID=1771310 RepID=A0ABV7X6R2_9SPHN